MDPKLESIICQYDVDFEIFNPDAGGVVVLKTDKKNDEMIKSIENWLNRVAITFGLEGPYTVKWETL